MNGHVADALIYLSENLFNSRKFKMILSRKDLADLSIKSSDDSNLKYLKIFKPNCQLFR